MITFDLLKHPDTDYNIDISNPNITTLLSSDYKYIVIHLAAARFDFGITPSEYNQLNVKSTESFVKQL